MAIFSVIEVTNEIVSALSTDGQGLKSTMGLPEDRADLDGAGRRAAAHPAAKPAQSGGGRTSALDSRSAANITRAAWRKTQLGCSRPITRPQPDQQHRAAWHLARPRHRRTAGRSPAAPVARPSGAGADPARRSTFIRSSRRARPAARRNAVRSGIARRDIIRRSRQRRSQDINDDNLPY